MSFAVTRPFVSVIPPALTLVRNAGRVGSLLGPASRTRSSTGLFAMTPAALRTIAVISTVPAPDDAIVGELVRSSIAVGVIVPPAALELLDAAALELLALLAGAAVPLGPPAAPPPPPAPPPQPASKPSNTLVTARESSDLVIERVIDMEVPWRRRNCAERSRLQFASF